MLEIEKRERIEEIEGSWREAGDKHVSASPLEPVYLRSSMKIKMGDSVGIHSISLFSREEKLICTSFTVDLSSSLSFVYSKMLLLLTTV